MSEQATAPADPAFADPMAGPFSPGELEQRLFFKRLLRELTGTLEKVVGVEKASGYIATVGGAMGEWLNAAYHDERGPEDFDIETVAQVFVDLKNRIDGGFAIESVSADEIVLRNTNCPFGDFVLGRPSLCMMTSNVFGRIGAENRDYARVVLNKTIAAGDGCCHVVVSFRPGEGNETDGREYYRSSHFTVE